MWNSSFSGSMPTQGNLDQLGGELFSFARKLFPLHRAITGAGVRATLELIADRIPIKRHQVPTGCPVLDWEVPMEWSIRDAFVELPNGRRIIDIGHSNLHVISYSLGIDQWLSWESLRPHLHTLADRPDWIPYRTAHYQNTWGFCLSHRQWDELRKDGARAPAHVVIDARQQPGHLDYAELYLPGRSDSEFLIATHICHPSLANDNVSGIVVATELARFLTTLDTLPMSVRVLFAPATIGAITWLALNRDRCHRIRGGLVLSNLGDRGPLTYKKSRQESATIDRIAESTLAQVAPGFRLRSFTPWGYDERQYCSPGFDLPMGRLTRTPEGEYPEYHTSADDLSLINSKSLADAVEAITAIVLQFAATFENDHSRSEQTLKAKLPAEGFNGVTNQPMAGQPTRRVSIQDAQQVGSIRPDRIFLNLRPFAEPRLDRYGLYSSFANSQNPEDRKAVLWMLNLSDGNHTIEDIANRSHIDPAVLNLAALTLVKCGLLREMD